MCNRRGGRGGPGEERHGVSIHGRDRATVRTQLFRNGPRDWRHFQGLPWAGRWAAGLCVDFSHQRAPSLSQVPFWLISPGEGRMHASPKPFRPVWVGRTSKPTLLFACRGSIQGGKDALPLAVARSTCPQASVSGGRASRGKTDRTETVMG